MVDGEPRPWLPSPSPAMDEITFKSDTVLSDVHLHTPNQRHLMVRLSGVGQPGKVPAPQGAHCVSCFLPEKIGKTGLFSLSSHHFLSALVSLSKPLCFPEHLLCARPGRDAGNAEGMSQALPGGAHGPVGESGPGDSPSPLPLPPADSSHRGSLVFLLHTLPHSSPQHPRGSFEKCKSYHCPDLDPPVASLALRRKPEPSLWPVRPSPCPCVHTSLSRPRCSVATFCPFPPLTHCMYLPL